MKVGFFIVFPQAAWQPALHFVARDAKAKFRTNIDLRPVNAATNTEKWPMSIIKAE